MYRIWHVYLACVFLEGAVPADFCNQFHVLCGPEMDGLKRLGCEFVGILISSREKCSDLGEYW